MCFYDGTVKVECLKHGASCLHCREACEASAREKDAMLAKKDAALQKIVGLLEIGSGTPMEEAHRRVLLAWDTAKEAISLTPASALSEVVNRAKAEAFEEALAAVENARVGPCYSSGLPCGCNRDAVKAVRAAAIRQRGGE